MPTCELAPIHLTLPARNVNLQGTLKLLRDGKGLVLFVHGSGSSRHSPRNHHVAKALQKRGLSTLLFDLLTPFEEEMDGRGAGLRFDIPLLGRRLLDVTEWATNHALTRNQPLGYFGASTGAAAALLAAAARPYAVKAIVSRGGRPDLAGPVLELVSTPTLLIVGGADSLVLELNQTAKRRMKAATGLAVVPGASHLFEEPGALDGVARMAGDWFSKYLSVGKPGAPSARAESTLDLNTQN